MEINRVFELLIDHHAVIVVSKKQQQQKTHYHNIRTSPFFTNAYTIWGQIILRRCFYFVIMNATSEAFASLISLPITVDLSIGHIITSSQDCGTICLTM